MYIKAKTLDDLLNAVFRKLLKSKIHVESTKGHSTEITGVLLELANPSTRLSRTEVKGKLFSCLGELLWYLSGANDLDFIQYYISLYEESSDDGQTIYGAYGPRLFNMRGEHNQFQNVINLLRKKPSSRQAVIQLFDASDIEEHHNDVPCTCSLQFLIRKNRLHMFTSMRSNDAFLGLPHDVFAFTMMQEIMARTLDVELGVYKHAVGSMHLYEKDADKAKQYLDEGWQSTICMPKMPNGDPWISIKKLLIVESKIRHGDVINPNELELEDYWADLARLLQVFRVYREGGDDKEIVRIEGEMSSDIYKVYINQRLGGAVKKALPEQLSLK